MVCHRPVPAPAVWPRRISRIGACDPRWPRVCSGLPTTEKSPCAPTPLHCMANHIGTYTASRPLQLSVGTHHERRKLHPTVYRLHARLNLVHLTFYRIDCPITGYSWHALPQRRISRCTAWGPHRQYVINGVAARHVPRPALRQTTTTAAR